MSSIDDALKYIATNEIRWIDLQFTDVKGTLHRVSVSNRKIEPNSFIDGINAADLVKVFGETGQKDLVLLPDPDTISRLPWEPSTVRFICNIMTGDSKEHFSHDSRYIAERLETNLAAQGIRNALIGAEVDCYMFDTATADKTSRARGAGTLMDSREARWSPSPLSNEDRGAFVVTPHDGMYSARAQISETMQDSFGFPVDGHRHGEAPTAQQTFDLTERSLKTAADGLHTLKFITRNLANAVNASATFMPYPIEGEKGSGLAVSVSLWKSTDSNLFFDSKEDYGQLSQAGRYFIGGLLEHANTLCAFCLPTPNSYRRLAINNPSFGWSAVKTDTVVSVPSSHKNSKEAKRIVFALPDPSINSYLAYSLIVAAGLDGIKNKLDSADPAESVAKKPGNKIKELPSTLMEALMALDSDDKFVRGIVSSEFLDAYVELKHVQHIESLKGVSALELHKYYNV